MRLSADSRSSPRPAAKNSCLGSPLKLVNGRMAIDGLAADGLAAGRGDGAIAAAVVSDPVQRQARTGVAMFLSCNSPATVKLALTLPFTCA